MSVFTPEHKPLDQIFSSGSTYRIPSYQRPYSWESLGRSDRDSQVIQMWKDLWDFFTKNKDNNKEYFLGSMVIIADPTRVRTFQVIDGQQRLTTLLLLFAAMRCLLLEQKNNASPEMHPWYSQAIQTIERFLFNQEGRGLVKNLKLKIERTTRVDYNIILDAAVHCRSIEEINKIPQKFKIIAERYFRNHKYLLEQLKRELLNKSNQNLDIHGQEIFDQFFQFLERRVAIVQIMTTEFDTAWGIFEILNNRGLPLSNLDLLRNFVLQELSEAGHEDSDSRWESLEKNYDLSEEFGSRWAESRIAQSLRGSAFNEIKRLYEEHYASDIVTGRKKIDVFVEDFERNLSWYNRWLNADRTDQISDRVIRNILSFIKLLGNDRYNANLVLSLFRCCNYEGSSDPRVLAFLSTYQTYAINVYLLGNRSADSIYTAIRAFNANDIEKARNLFILNEEERKKLHQYFDSPIPDNESAKRLLIAYIWHQEEQVNDVVTQQLNVEKCTLEHIIPQTPEQGSNWLIDFSEDFRSNFTYRIGNMTLLTQSRNSANKNFDFSRKRKIYEKANLRMTLDVARESRLTQQFFDSRQTELVSVLKRIFS